MLFIVDYRDKTGRRATVELDALDKNAVLAELGRRGISALAIRAGEPKSAKNGLSISKMKIFKYVGLGVLTVLAICFAFLSLLKDGKKVDSTATTGKHKLSDRNQFHGAAREVKSAKSTDEAAPADKVKETQSTPESATPPVAHNKYVITNKVAQSVRSRYDVFEHRVESELAFLACMPLGTMVIGNRDFDEQFMQELNVALDDEITISDDDTDETKYYKQTVMDLKKELGSMLKNGEDVAAALSQTRKELQDLGVYKTQLEIELNRFMSNGEDVSEQDVEDFVNAANIMLKEKGIEPFEFNSLTRTIMRHRPLFNSKGQIDNQEGADHE